MDRSRNVSQGFISYSRHSRFAECDSTTTSLLSLPMADLAKICSCPRGMDRRSLKACIVMLSSSSRQIPWMSDAEGNVIQIGPGWAEWIGQAPGTADRRRLGQAGAIPTTCRASSRRGAKAWLPANPINANTGSGPPTAAIAGAARARPPAATRPGRSCSGTGPRKTSTTARKRNRPCRAMPGSWRWSPQASR